MSPAGASSTEARIAAQPWTWRLWQMALSYLPILVMAGLAASTWWLVKNSLPDTEQVASLPLRHEPDYEMSRFMVHRYNPDGSLKARLEGERLRHYPDTNTHEIDGVRVHAIDAAGQITTARALRAVTDNTAKEIELLGAAEVVRVARAGSAAVEFRSESLHARLDLQRVLSDRRVTMTHGSIFVQADNMQYDHGARVLRFGGRTHATFHPKPQP